MRKLTDLFVYELFKLATKNKTHLEKIKEHFSYTFIEMSSAQKSFRTLFDYHKKKDDIPSFGTLSELCDSKEAIVFLEKAKDIVIREEDIPEIYRLYESFLKEKRFVQMNIDIVALYSEGKVSEATTLAEEESKSIQEFRLERDEVVEVFSGYEERQKERDEKISEEYIFEKKIPIGIPQIDYALHGGTEKGTGTLFMARSGVGKSTLLRSICFYNALRGRDCAYVHAEDTQENVEFYFDSMWSNIPFIDLKKNNITQEQRVLLNKAIKELKRRAGKIYVISYSGLKDSPSVVDAYNRIKDLDISLACFDYVDLFSPDGSKFAHDEFSQRNKKYLTGNKLCSLAVEMDIAIFTAVQANNIPESIWNNTGEVLDRTHISDNKRLIDPFSYFFTLNQTIDEDDEDECRVHNDKSRHAKIKGDLKTVKVAMNRKFGKFVHEKNTFARFWDRENNCVKKITE